MTLAVLTFFLILALGLVIWRGSLMLTALTGAPSIYSSRQAAIDAFRLAELKSGQTVIDLGCGDGRSLIIAAKQFGARGIGVELSPYCYALAKFNVWRAGESRRVKIIFGDFRKIEPYLKNTSIIYAYLLPATLAKLEPWLFAHMASDTSVISVAFQIANRQPDRRVKTTNLGRPSEVYLYRVTS